ncbi:MAG: serine/threonine-protein kinase [Pirellula sp.]
MKCNPSLMHVLLDGDEESQDYLEASKHVDTCIACQSRLEHMSSVDDDWWIDAKSVWSREELPDSSDLIETNSVIVKLGSDPMSVEMPDSVELHLRESIRHSETSDVLGIFLSAPTHPELLGRIGRYDVERIIGQGGMGVVLKGYDSELHRVVAIKVLLPHLANSVAARKRFAREARAAAAIVHPHVIPIFDVESEAKLPYLVMQYVNGMSLQNRIEQFGPVQVCDALRIGQQTAAGLAAAHEQGLVHRDVKPANIMMEEQVERVVLSDFGLARAVDDASLTRTGVIAGTPHYMSPEQASGEVVGVQSDLFSLGSVMYFMLTGHPPFRAEGAMAVLNRICNTEHRPLEQINNEVPCEVARLVDRLLSKNPSERFESAHAVEEELKRMLALIQSGQMTLRPKKRWLLPKLKMRWVVAAALVVIACTLFPTTLPILFRREAPPRPELTVRQFKELVEQLDLEQSATNDWFKQADQVSDSVRSLKEQWQTRESHPLFDPFWNESEALLQQLKRRNQEYSVSP